MVKIHKWKMQNEIQGRIIMLAYALRKMKLHEELLCRVLLADVLKDLLSMRLYRDYTSAAPRGQDDPLWLGTNYRTVDGWLAIVNPDLLHPSTPPPRPLLQRSNATERR